MLAPLSLRQFQDVDGKPILTARLFVYATGTTTPANVYRTSSLDPTQMHPWPVPVDGRGFLPAIFVGQGDYDVLLTDGASLSPPGAVLLSAQDLSGDPSSTSPPSYDPQRQIQTGMYGFFAASGGVNGWVPANGGTIGNAGSGASTRASADCAALFEFLWEGRPDLAVSPARGDSAGGDFAAGAALALPDLNSRFLAFVAAGSPSGNLLTGGKFDPASPGGTLLGAFGGEATHALTADELATHAHLAAFAGELVADHQHTVTVGDDSPDHSHNLTVRGFNIISATTDAVIASFFALPNGDAGIATVTGGAQGKHQHPATCSAAGGHTPAGAVTIENTGSSAAHNTLPPFVVAGAAYLKL